MSEEEIKQSHFSTPVGSFVLQLASQMQQFSLSKLTIHIVHLMSICDQRIKPLVV
jgi:hypothetical protein